MSKSTLLSKAPVLTVQEALHWKYERGPVPHSELLIELRGRDLVFVIDDSSSMQQHFAELRPVIGLLMDILKQSNADRGREGFDVHFTINSKMLSKVKRSKEIFRVLDSSIATGASNMEAKLASIIPDYMAKFDGSRISRVSWPSFRKAKTSWGLSLYVLTDGIWQPKNDPSRVFKPLIRHLKERNLSENRIGIQFIRFGHEGKGAALLDCLDADSSSGLDIVDTEPAEGNVWKMLLASVNHWFDDDINKFNDSG